MSCYIINKSPHIALDDKASKEVWTDKLIDCFGLRKFGYPCYVHIQDLQRSKMDSKSKECILFGFKQGVKGYKLWDPTSYKVKISRNIVFNDE